MGEAALTYKAYLTSDDINVHSGNNIFWVQVTEQGHIIFHIFQCGNSAAGDQELTLSTC